MAAGGKTVELGPDGREQPAEDALIAKQFSGEIADMRGFDFAGFDIAAVERAVDGFFHQRGDVLVFAAVVAREIGLVSAENENVLRHR